MSQLKINVYLSSETALKNGHIEYGELSVAPTAEQLALLTDEQRAALAAYTYGSQRLHVPSPTWPGVLEGLSAAQEREAAKRAEREACVEGERAEYRRLLALPALYAPGLPLKEIRNVYPPNYGRGDPEAERLHAEVAERRSAERREKILSADTALGDPARHVSDEGLSNEANAVLKAAQVWRDRNFVTDPVPPIATEALARLEALREARKQEEERRRESLECDARTWAAEHATAALAAPEIQRAAREGRRVRNAITTAVEELLRDHVMHAIPEYASVVEVYDIQDRDDVPSREAYATLDAIRVASKTWANQLPELEIADSGVCRIDVAAHGDPEWRTGVVVTASHPWFTETIEIAVISEPLNLDEDDAPCD